MSERHPIPSHRNFQDLTGRVFGRLTVLGYHGKRGKHPNGVWLCRCECGVEKVIASHHLKHGNAQSCGCLGREKIARSHKGKRSHAFRDLTGQRFERLVAIRCVTQPAETLVPRWLCRCDCGNETVVRSSNLVHDITKSCGCLRRENPAKYKTTHGATGTRELSIYRHIIRRCHDPKSRGYAAYGSVGIKVCQRWRDSFPDFLADVGPCPSDQHSLDRFPNQQGDYEPDNVRWATAAEQNRNKSNNVMLTHGGKTLCMQDWSEITGLSPGTIHYRIKAGWSDERIVTTPALPRRGRKIQQFKPFTFCG